MAALGFLFLLSRCFPDVNSRSGESHAIRH
jgi:hypothetical protein